MSRLLAKLDEEEARARTMVHHSPDDGGYYSCPAVHTEPYGDLPWGENACDCGLKERRDSVLRLCQAHRKIIDKYLSQFEINKGEHDLAQSGALLALHGVVRDLADGYGITEQEDN